MHVSVCEMKGEHSNNTWVMEIACRRINTTVSIQTSEYECVPSYQGTNRSKKSVNTTLDELHHMTYHNVSLFI